MMLHRTAFFAVTMAVAWATAAQAQSPFPPAGAELQQQNAFPPAGGPQPAPWPSAGATPIFGAPHQQPQQQQQEPPCLKDFIPLREEVDKRFNVVKNTMQKKPTAQEACAVLQRFTQAEVTLIKFVEKNAASCGLPAQLLETVKASNAKSEDFKKKACSAAAQQQARPARAAEPTLSDALGAPAPTAGNTHGGRGTFDTLTGNPLTR